MKHRTRPTCRIVNGEPVWRFRCDCGETGPSHSGPDGCDLAKVDARVHERPELAAPDWSVVESWLR